MKRCFQGLIKILLLQGTTPFAVDMESSMRNCCTRRLAAHAWHMTAESALSPTSNTWRPDIHTIHALLHTNHKNDSQQLIIPQFKQ